MNGPPTKDDIAKFEARLKVITQRLSDIGADRTYIFGLLFESKGSSSEFGSVDKKLAQKTGVLQTSVKGRRKFLPPGKMCKERFFKTLEVLKATATDLEAKISVEQDENVKGSLAEDLEETNQLRYFLLGGFEPIDAKLFFEELTRLMLEKTEIYETLRNMQAGGNDVGEIGDDILVKPADLTAKNQSGCTLL